MIREEKYFWTVSPGSGYIIIIAEHETYRGRGLEVYFSSDIDSFGVNVPNTEHLNLKIVRPKDIEYFIGQALEQGWKPDEKGRPLVFEFDSVQLNRLCGSRSNDRLSFSFEVTGKIAQQVINGNFRIVL